MALTEEQRKKNAKSMAIYMSVIGGIICMYFFGYIGSVMDTNILDLGRAVPATIERIKEGEFFFSITANAIVGLSLGLIMAGVFFFIINNDNERNYSYKMDEVAGTGGFMPEKEFKEYKEKFIATDPPVVKDYNKISGDWTVEKKHYSQNMIMSNEFCRPINSRALIGNNNILVVGGAGTGKSRFFIKPNLLQMNASYVITDPSGEMINNLGQVLANNGYKIKIFNISDMAHSNTYNPLRYIRDEAGVNMLISCLINNTTKGEGGGDNQFFVDAEKLLYSACIFYLTQFNQDESKKNFAGVMDMINSSQVDENNANAKSKLDELFDCLPKGSLAWKYYKAFKQAAGKTLKSIIISCVTRLQPFMTPQVVNLTKSDEMELETLGDEKTALFIITPQADRTYSFLASMLYSQLFETLYYVGEQQMANGGDVQLKIPVRCMMDEFANIGEVPEFPSKLATMRKYNISAAIVLQDIAQIEAMYKDDWKTLVGNCSTMVFLGTQEPNTLKYFSEMLGKMTVRSKSTGFSDGGKGGSNKNFQYTAREVMTPDELGRMAPDECIVFTQNKRPVHDKKFKYETHPYYPYTGDANDDNCFEYNKLSVYDNTRAGKYSNILIAQSEAARYKKKYADTTLKSTDDVIIKGDANLLANKFEPSVVIKEKLYRESMIECMEKTVEQYDKKVCLFQVDNIPYKYLYKLVEQTCVAARKGSVIIFTTVENQQNYSVGVGVFAEDVNIDEIVKFEHLQGHNVEKDFYTFLLNRNYVDDFRDYIETII